MPHYYFDLHNDLDAEDSEGGDFPDLGSAVTYALFEARTMIQASVAETGRIDLSHHIDIRDETGAIVHVLHFEDAITVQRGTQVISSASITPPPGH